MNPLDYHVITFLNQFAQRSWTFDAFVDLIGRNYILKTGILTAFLGWAWMRKGQDGRDHRPVVVFGLVASCAAVLTARILSFVVPFRERPLRNPDLNFVLPFPIGPQAIWGWNSFPSDNAALFFGVAACLFLVSRPVGIWAFCHVMVVVGFARVYLGFHHPTDILMGAALGVAAVSLINFQTVRTAVLQWPMRWLHSSPQSFHAALFFLVLMIATTFDPVYDLARFTKVVARATLHLTVAVYR
jgi:undecaprenyl-diphosphatase